MRIKLCTLRAVQDHATFDFWAESRRRFQEGGDLFPTDYRQVYFRLDTRGSITVDAKVAEGFLSWAKKIPGWAEDGGPRAVYGEDAGERQLTVKQFSELDNAEYGKLRMRQWEVSKLNGNRLRTVWSLFDLGLVMTDVFGCLRLTERGRMILIAERARRRARQTP
jgi:hypothetical protein